MWTSGCRWNNSIVSVFNVAVVSVFFFFLSNPGLRWCFWRALAGEWHYPQTDQIPGIQSPCPLKRQRWEWSVLTLRSVLHRRRGKELQVLQHMHCNTNILSHTCSIHQTNNKEVFLFKLFISEINICNKVPHNWYFPLGQEAINITVDMKSFFFSFLTASFNIEEALGRI